MTSSFPYRRWRHFTARKSERKQLLDCFDRLARNPALETDWRPMDASERTNFQIAAGRFLVTFWPDHATREVRIVRLERFNQEGLPRLRRTPRFEEGRATVLHAHPFLQTSVPRAA